MAAGPSRRSHARRAVRAVPVVYLAAGAASAVALVPEADAGATTPTGVPFSHAGGAQTFTLPAGVTSRSMVTTGAGGGTGACERRADLDDHMIRGDSRLPGPQVTHFTVRAEQPISAATSGTVLSHPELRLDNGRSGTGRPAEPVARRNRKRGAQRATVAADPERIAPFRPPGFSGQSGMTFRPQVPFVTSAKLTYHARTPQTVVMYPPAS